MQFLKAFLFGGALCAVGQILIDRTRLTPARILAAYVVSGVFLGALGLYEPLVQWAGAGATARGVREAVKSDGLRGALLGGLTACAGGIAAAVFFGFLSALVFRPEDKS